MPLDLQDPMTYTTPMANDQIGICHICKRSALIRFCPVCDHWFCQNCRKAFFWRGLEAVKELIVGKHPGCCGPTEESPNAL